jgi:hypothetical protein
LLGSARAAAHAALDVSSLKICLELKRSRKRGSVNPRQQILAQSLMVKGMSDSSEEAIVARLGFERTHHVCCNSTPRDSSSLVPFLAGSQFKHGRLRPRLAWKALGIALNLMKAIRTFVPVLILLSRPNSQVANRFG